MAPSRPRPLPLLSSLAILIPANKSQVRNQTKNGLKDLSCPDEGHQRPYLKPGLEVLLDGEQLVARPAPIRAWPGSAGKDNVGPRSHRLTCCERSHGGQVQCELDGQRQESWRFDHQLQNLALRMWKRKRKEPKLVCEVEKFRLHIVGPYLIHRVACTLVPVLLREVGLSSNLELAMERGDEQVCAYSLCGGTCTNCCLCLCTFSSYTQHSAQKLFEWSAVLMYMWIYNLFF